VSVIDLQVTGGPSTSELTRTPPQDLAAEQSVLGGMMLSKDAIPDVIELLRGNDFYRPAHELIYEAVLDLYGRGEPADAVTVAAELTKRGELARVGGPAYLHTLIAAVPTAANAGYYARIVRERAVLRRLVEAGTRIVQLGYATDGGDVEEIVNAAQAEVYAVTERRTSEDYLPLSEIMEGAIDEIEASSHRGDGLIGVPTGFADLDRLTNGLHAGQMIVIAARPAVGKSTVGLDIARSASIHNGMPAVIFSLEMSRNEITMRLLSAEARIPLQNMRKGTMREEDWTRLARTMGEINEAPLFVDDSPNMSLMEIRAKCRRLKQRHDLKLVIVDYLQLMSSGKRVESRQQEVSEFSRALKLLAKELEVPVIAISQLNRGPEQRTDKKPQMSDLRESGCLTAETRVLRADTGAEVSLGELFTSGARDVPVWSLDDRLRYRPAHLTHVFRTGCRPVLRMRLASGRTVRATANHPFLGSAGWIALGDLHVGDRIAVSRHVPAPAARVHWTDEELHRVAARLAGTDGAGLRGVGPTASTAPGAVPGTIGEAGSAGIPAEVCALGKPQLRLFLRAVCAAAGAHVVEDRTEAPALSGLVRLPLPRRSQADLVARLLLRFGILGTVRSGARGVTVELSDRDDLRRFLQEIGLTGAARPAADRLLAHVRAQGAPAADPRPHPDLHPYPGDAGSRLPAPGSRGEDAGSRPWERCSRPGDPGSPLWDEVGQLIGPARSCAGQPLGAVSALLAGAELRVHAVNDVLWDEVVSLESDGVEDVFDATVLGTHNFVAGGIVVHNSIEQDADMVILLHREDMYEKESPRAGEADFIVAKHRNGPTDTITVAFQGHYSRFVDMAT